MAPLKEAVLLILAVCAIVFSYLLASGVLLFALCDGRHSVDVRNRLQSAIGRAPNSASQNHHESFT
jgi:hypothetical protein